MTRSPTVAILVLFALFAAPFTARADESAPRLWMAGQTVTFENIPLDGDEPTPWPEPWTIDGEYREARPPRLRVDRADTTNHVAWVDENSRVRIHRADLAAVDTAQATRIYWWQDQHTVRNTAGLLARYQPATGDDNAGRRAYRAELSVNPRELRLVSDVDGEQSILANVELEWSNQRWYHLQLHVRQLDDQRTELRAKLWPDGEPEPGDWTLTHIDDTPELQNLEGHVGITGRSTGNRMWAYDDYLALPAADAIEGNVTAADDGDVTIERADGETVTLAFSDLDLRDRQDLILRRGRRAVEASPDWVDGYRVRYKLRIASDVVNQPTDTVTAALPNGGWLKDDASDLVVKTRDGTEIPALVLSHAPQADTIIQFRRVPTETVYWVYASNPDAPDPDPALEQRLEKAREASEQAQLAMMAAQQKAGERAGELRDLQAGIKKHRETLESATKELAEWKELLPERIEDQKKAAEALKQAEQEHKEAAAAHEEPGRIADEKSAAARKLTRAAEAAQREVDKAKQAHAQAQQKLTEMREQEEPSPEDIQQAEQAVKDAAEAITAAEEKAEQAQAKAEPAEEAARQARLDAAPTASTLEKAEKKLNTARSRANRTNNLVKEARDGIKSAEKLIADSEKALAELEPKLEPTKKAAEQARTAARNAAEQAKQQDEAYYELAYETDPRLFKEGTTVEYRQWEGDTLGGWPDVVDGLQRSDTITDNAIVSSTYQKTKLFRATSPRDFAASYRGYLEIDEPGIYSFFVNADDTAFLFINGYLVYSRTGTNAPIEGRVPTYSVGADMQLEAGTHTIEVHHVVGNTLGATGYEMLLWIPPDADGWQFVPQEAFTRSALAVPVAVEAQDGKSVAIFRGGVDDKLTADGVSLYLARYEALGDAEQHEWSFADGTTTSGQSIRHVFFEPGDTTVALKSHPNVPPFRRRVHIDPPPNPVAPRSLHRAVEVIGAMALDQLATPKLNDTYHFLRICGQDNRWPVTEHVARELLSRENIDPQQQALLYSSLIHALAQQGRSSDAVEMIDEALAAVGDVRTLRARVMLEAANMYRDVMRDFAAADELYQRIIDENRRLRHPVVREAAVAWGDMYLDAGNRAQAGEAYRMAQRLGRVGAGPERGNPVAQGALLRMAEQQLEQDDVRQSRRMLRRIEQNHPEQKLDGLYRFLRAEADRHAGEYERAIRHYEVVTQLQEWSSYHPHALRGIADSYARLGEFTEALDWYEAVKDSYPDFYQDEDLKQTVETIRTRRERAAADGEAEGDGLFDQVAHDFETQTEADATLAPPITMGFDGPGTFLLRPGDGETTLPTVELKNLPGQGSLWIEMWFRTRVGDTLQGAHIRYIEARVYDSGNSQVAAERFYAPRTFGEWQKVAFAYDAPSTPDGRVVIQARCGAELMEIDSVEVRHVSDGENSALRRFQAGANPQ